MCRVRVTHRAASGVLAWSVCTQPHARGAETDKCVHTALSTHKSVRRRAECVECLEYTTSLYSREQSVSTRVEGTLNSNIYSAIARHQTVRQRGDDRFEIVECVERCAEREGHNTTKARVPTKTTSRPRLPVHPAGAGFVCSRTARRPLSSSA